MLEKKYRTNSAIGALLDEYERAIRDLQHLISGVNLEELTVIVDANTSDPDCRSIQTILTHVVRSAFGYATYIRNQQGAGIPFRRRKSCSSIEQYAMELDAAFAFTEETFQLFPKIKLESYEAEQKMRVRWGQLYDVEQIMEHAIVHILRHRRQIERFLQTLRKNV